MYSNKFLYLLKIRHSKNDISLLIQINKLCILYRITQFYTLCKLPQLPQSYKAFKKSAKIKKLVIFSSMDTFCTAFIIILIMQTKELNKHNKITQMRQPFFTWFTSSTRLHPPNYLFFLFLYQNRVLTKITAHSWPVYLSSRFYTERRL